ncbi:unnamed protein product [Blepharisma stoltei]|uniref:Ubiquitin-like domain-containing protein n=1 Tax=Blepharisma stoltei TaxID=1481888 RepID=A0AAU9IU91_9CILI|nr:unnamed protein product [Blepharisma stoltei]
MGKYDEIVEESVESQQPMSILSAPGEPNEAAVSQSLITILVKVSDTDTRSILVDPAAEIVGNLKIKLFPKEMQENKYVRLIFGGRVLVDSHLISLYKLSDKCVIHGFVTDVVDEQPGSSRTMLRRQQARGLDKLEESGFTVDDIHGMKFHFHAMCVYSGINKDTEEEKVALEEKWLEGKLPIINASPDERTRIQLNSLHERGDGLNFILGFLIGVLLSFLSLFVLKYFKLNEFQKFGTQVGLVLSLPIFILTLVIIFTGEF